MHALAGTVADWALAVAVLYEPLEDVLGVSPVLALLAPDKPHLDVSAHAGLLGRLLSLRTHCLPSYLLIAGLGLLELHLVVDHTNRVQAHGAPWDHLAALAGAGDHFHVLLVEVECFARIHEVLHLVLNREG